MRNYRFEIDTPIKNCVSIIIRNEDASTARTDAYNALRSVFGVIARVKTASADAKIMRRMPKHIEVIRNCTRYDENGTPVDRAWFVYKV
jgi:hypothetical protein